MLIEEFDPSPSAIIEPHDMINPMSDQMPEIVVSCFERSVFDRLLSINGGIEITYYSTPKQKTPIYCTLYKGKRIAITLMDIGAAACVCFCEVLYALGAKMIILFGSCGVLDSQISSNSIIIPNYALRDEGVSFHYMPPEDEISVNSEYIKEFTALLKNEQIDYSIGKVWTTDALFRETKEKVRQRKKQGCICVDMECSAVASMAKFRKKGIFHFFYAADSLDKDEWDRRSANKPIRSVKREAAAYIAMEFAFRCTM